MKIEDQVITFPFCYNKADDMLLEFFVCKTNELNPTREVRELGIVIYEKGLCVSAVIELLTLKF